MHTHEALRIAIEEKGPKEVAAALHVSLSLVYKWIEAKAANPLDRVLEIVSTTGSTLPIAHLCAATGGTYVRRPLPADIDGSSLVAETQRMLKEFSDVLQAMTTSFLDGHVSREEAALIREEWEELLPIAEGLVRACEVKALQDAPRPASTATTRSPLSVQTRARASMKSTSTKSASNTSPSKKRSERSSEHTKRPARPRTHEE